MTNNLLSDQQPPNKGLALRSIQSGIDNYIHKLCAKYNIENSEFKNWKSEILHMVTAEFDRMNSYHYFTVLKDSEVIVGLQK